uniref:Uncharacterized protein n=1 Tax=Romanomermis culicivorax TaxID=13658 RepID=A0A915HZS4_ROMCU
MGYSFGLLIFGLYQDYLIKTLVYLTLEPFDFSSVDASQDRVTVEWLVAKGNVFAKEWFQDDGAIVRRRNIPVQYNT